jgi:putative spermidine/putrescine transport system ATP-binding protein
MIGGFETVTAGVIELDGRPLLDTPPSRRPVNTVFQSYALFPHLNVADNVAFGLALRRLPRMEVAQRVAEALQMVRMESMGERRPRELSGGQQQRVALARALAPKPQILLLDEPLSALDAKIRVSLREEIRAVQRELGITTVFVTHDQEEALSISDRIVVMHEGRADQLGTPFEIYNYPRTRFVASFVGTLSVMRGRVVDPARGTLTVDDQTVIAKRGLEGAKAGEVRSVAVRPEAVSLAPANGEDNSLQGTIEEVHFLGAIVRVRVRFKEHAVSLDTFNHPGTPPPERGRPATVRFRHEDLLVLEGTEPA